MSSRVSGQVPGKAKVVPLQSAHRTCIAPFSKIRSHAFPSSPAQDTATRSCLYPPAQVFMRGELLGRLRMKDSKTCSAGTRWLGISGEKLTKMLPVYPGIPSLLSERLTFTRHLANMPIIKAHLIRFPLLPDYQKSAPFVFVSDCLSKNLTFWLVKLMMKHFCYQKDAPFVSQYSNFCCGIILKVRTL